MNTGIPGTGMSWRNKITPSDKKTSQKNSLPPITSDQPHEIASSLRNTTYAIKTSEGLVELCEQIREMMRIQRFCSHQITLTKCEIGKLQIEIQKLEDRWLPQKKAIRESELRINELKIELEEHESCLADNQARLDFQLDPPTEAQYQKVVTSFIDLSQSDRIWDITSTKSNPNAGSISNVKSVVERSLVTFDLENIEGIESPFTTLHLQNASGADLYLFPSCIILERNSGELLFVDLKELKLEHRPQSFIESPSTVPYDSEIIEHVWEKTNKDGSPDLRYNNNVKQPVVLYGSLHFSNHNGLDETYYVSNAKAVENFANELAKYLSLLKDEEAQDTSTPLSKPISYNPGQASSSPILSKEYFDLLSEIIDDTKNLSSNIQEDADIIKFVSKSMDSSDTSPEEYISYCITFDAARVFLELLGETTIIGPAHKSALALLASRLMDRPKLYQTVSFEMINSAHLNEYTDKLANIFLDQGRTDCPMKFSLKGSDDSSFNQQGKFVFPTFLKSIESPYFDKFTTTLCRLATVIAKADGTISKDEDIILKKIFNMIRYPLGDVSQSIEKNTVNPQEEQTLDEVIEELEQLVGLESVKHEVKTLINLAKVHKKREKLDLKSTPMSYHLVLTGAPGTGKTTVARIISKIYNRLGILDKGHLVETDRSGLVAGYVGQTAAKVNKVIDSALNGVLFIDEAYSLTQDSEKDYGGEAISTLLKRMEDERDCLVVIVAGYTKEMKSFLKTNSGLKSRFNRFIEFPDYRPEEMAQIFERKCHSLDYYVENAAMSKVLDLLKHAYRMRDRSFGNGRYVRNIFETALRHQANRVAEVSHVTKEILTTIIASDIPDQ